MVTLAQLQHSLTETGEAHDTLDIGGGMRILLSQRGARVLGIFHAEDSANLLWTNSALENPSSLAAFFAEGGWNLGGERCWIAPEIQFNVRDRSDFWANLFVPTAMDPGHYKLERRGNSLHFEQASMTLQAFNLASGSTELAVSRDIRSVRNPLTGHPDATSLMDGLRFGGYEQVCTLEQRDHSPICSEIWNLVQLNAGGTLIIPCKEPLGATDYFGSVPEEAREIHPGPSLRLSITGKRQYKIGYKAYSMRGQMAYLMTEGPGPAYLLLRSFFNNPSNPYIEEAPELPGENGHSVHVYNDGGSYGGDNSFGEMECTGTSIGASLGKQRSTDSFIMCAYVGAADSVKRVCEVLTGINL